MNPWISPHSMTANVRSSTFAKLLIHNHGWHNNRNFNSPLPIDNIGTEVPNY